MRKLFSLIAAVLFAGSMMAGVESVDFSAQGYENQQAIESYAGTNFTVTFDKGTSSNAPKYYTSGTAIRCYGANTFTVASESTISQIVLTYGASDGSNEITAAPGTFATDTWTGSANSVVFTIGGTSGNRRIKGIEVTFDGEGGGETPGGDTPGGDTPEVTDPTNCAEAATAALSVSANNELYNGGKSYTIQGYVTEIAYAYSASSGNMSFWMADTKEGGKVLEAYKCTITSEENAPAVGDKVAVTGQLTKYNTTPEFAAGCTVAIIEKAGGDTPGGDTPGGDTPATGDAESVDFSAQGYENQQAIESYSGTNFTVTFDKGTNSNAPKYYTTGTAIRCYGANTFTVASTKTIVKIVLTYGSGDGSNEITAAPGTFATDTWTGSANSVVFTIGGTSGQRRIKGIEVTFAEGGDTPVEPTVNYYVAGTMNGWAANADYMLTPSNNGEYKGEFAFAENDEFKVIGVEGETITWYPAGMNNNFQITQAGDYKIFFNPAGNVDGWYEGYFNVLMKEEPVVTAITCLEVYQKAKDDAVLLNPVTVTYSNGANVWVMDGSASMLIYLPSGFTNNFLAGDVLSGIAGTVDIYQNIVYEIKPSADQAAAIVATPGEAPAPSQAAVIEASDVNKYVILPGFSIEGAFTAASKTSLPAALGEDTVTIYNNFKFAYTFEAGKTYDIIGVVSAYKGNPQVYFISATEAGGVVPPTPSINYYVAGSMNGWAANEAYMLTPNNEKLYQGEFTFAANDEFKVIGVEGETITWYPAGMNNNFKITEAGDYKITFNPAGNVEGWYEGFFNVVKKEEPVIPQYEVAEAIAAGLTDDTEILVRGIITKMEFKGTNFVKYGSVNIYVADATGAEGEFEFYNCYSLNADTFRTSTPNYDPTNKNWAQFREVVDGNGNAIHVGDTVIAFGKYKLYNTTHELNTGCYLVDVKSAPVAPAQDINVNMSDGLVYSDYVAAEGWWQIYGSNEKFDVSISNVSTTQAEGTYAISDLDADYTYVGVINGNDTNYVSFVDGSVTLSIDAQTGNVTVAGTLVGDDGNNYIINLVFVSPKPTETVNVNIQNGELIDDYADYGLYGVYGTDANDIYVQFAIWAETFEGNFSETDLDYNYIGSAIFEGEEQVNIYTAAITVTPGNGGDYTITATVLGYNNKQYNVTMYVPATATGIEETIATGKAVKTISNGMLLIEKAGVKYSVMGQKIR